MQLELENSTEVEAELKLPIGVEGELELGPPIEAEDLPELELHTGVEDEAVVNSHISLYILAHPTGVRNSFYRRSGHVT